MARLAMHRPLDQERRPKQADDKGHKAADEHRQINGEGNIQCVHGLCLIFG